MEKNESNGRVFRWKTRWNYPLSRKREAVNSLKKGYDN